MGSAWWVWTQAPHAKHKVADFDFRSAHVKGNVFPFLISKNLKSGIDFVKLQKWRLGFVSWWIIFLIKWAAIWSNFWINVIKNNPLLHCDLQVESTCSFRFSTFKIVIVGPFINVKRMENTGLLESLRFQAWKFFLTGFISYRSSEKDKLTLPQNLKPSCVMGWQWEEKASNTPRLLKVFLL